MQPSLWLVLAVSLAGDIIVFLASTILLVHRRLVYLLATYATPFAAGALLAAAFLDFLHDGVTEYSPNVVLTSALVGVLFFFLLEGWLHWFHHHGKETSEESNQPHHQHDTATQPVLVLITTGNWLHNFIDGAAIAAAFLVSVSTGVVTTIAVALHEIPREIADSGYLLERGMKRRGVIMVHGVAILVTAIGTILFYQTAQANSNLLAVLIGSTAGFFIYIAASDIIPSINASRKKGAILDWQSALVILGAALVGVAIVISHHYIA